MNCLNRGESNKSEPVNVDESFWYHSCYGTEQVRPESHACHDNSVVENRVRKWGNPKDRHDSELMEPASFCS